MNSEAIILGLILRDEDIWYLAGLTKDMFVDHRAVSTFAAMQSAIKKQGYISRDTVGAELGNKELLNWIEREAETEIATARWEFHRERLVRSWKQKQLHLLSLEIADALKNDPEPDTVADQIMQDARDIRLDHAQDASQSYQERLRAVLDTLSTRRTMEGIVGLPTGFRSLDGATGGFQNRRLYYVAARPSQGKSALLGQFADTAIKEGKRVGFISLESSSEELIVRRFSRRYRIPHRSIQNGMITGAQFTDLSREVERSKDMVLLIDDTPNSDINHVTRQANLWKARYDIDVLFIDYAQLIRVSTARDRRESVEEASRSLKDLSRHLNIPVVAAAQLRRDVDGRDPHLGDFQHSSALEQDADTAILLHWKSMYGQEIPVDVYVAKNRDGEKAKFGFIFEGNYVSFKEGDYVD